MLACVDVQYAAGGATAACVGFEAWTDAAPGYEAVATSPQAPADYRPGAFYERELPYVRAMLEPLAARLEIAIVDGYVWLGPGRAGLGAHLHAALGCAVVGVAKSPFAGADAVAISRAGTRPLYVTAVGVDPEVAAAHVRAMHGPYRIPTLLRRVDQLARGLVRPAAAH